VSGSRFDLFVGDDANWDRLMNRPAGILHIAASRFWDESCPSVSKLILSRNATDMVGPSNRVPMFRRASTGDLVFLSAAATARGQLLPGDGPQSLARSFLDAGASSVIATQWQVSDQATPILARTFYQSVLQSLDFESSLREAKLALLQYRPDGLSADEPPPYAHPFYWAPYVLIGR
jgi:CHAT domain-containing protein